MIGYLKGKYIHLTFHFRKLVIVSMVSRINRFEDSVSVALYQISVRLENCTAIPSNISHINTTSIKVGKKII